MTRGDGCYRYRLTDRCWDSGKPQVFHRRATWAGQWGGELSRFELLMIKREHTAYGRRARELLDSLCYDRRKGPDPFHDRYSAGGWQRWKLKSA